MGDTVIKEADNVTSWVTIVIVIVFLIIFILIRVLCGRVLRDIAIKKGYREKYWWWLGFLFNIFFGILVLFIVSHIKERKIYYSDSLNSYITIKGVNDSNNGMRIITPTNKLSNTSLNVTTVDENKENATNNNTTTKTTYPVVDENKEKTINNNILVFKIKNYQSINESKLIDRIMKIEHITDAKISPDGILYCCYDDTIKTEFEILSLKELIKLQITK